jgi:hypothetical protein
MPPEDFKRDILFEIERLRALAAAARAAMQRPGLEKDAWDAAAAGKMISDLVGGLESLLKRKARADGKILPQGPDWHLVLLNGFLADPAFGYTWTESQKALWTRYLRFRHRFIHGYGHEMGWSMVREPLVELPAMAEALALVWENWVNRPKN